MKPFFKQFLTLVTSSVLVACAASDSQDDGRADADDRRRDDCIFEASIRGYTVLDESNLIVSASGRRYYHVVLRQRAFGLNSSWGIGFDSSTGSICSGFSRVVFEGGFREESVPIHTIRRLTEDEREDLMIRYGKMKPEIEQGPVPAEVEGAEIEELDPAADEPSGN